MIRFNKIATKLLALIALSGISSPSFPQDDVLVYESSNGHFKYVLHNGLTPDDVLKSTDILEQYFERVLSDLNVESVPQTTVTIWNDPEEFYQAQEETIGQRFEGSGGYAWWGGFPELRLRHSTWDQAAIAALHEYAHIVTMVRNSSIPNNPRWLWETIAIYATRDIQSETPKIPEFMAKKDFPTLDDLNVGFNSDEERRNIYDVGLFLGQYIVANWGISALGELAESNGDLGESLHISVSDFERGWHSYFEANYLN